MTFPNLHPALSALPSGAMLFWLAFEIFLPREHKAKRLAACLALLFTAASFGSGYLANYLLSNKLVEMHSNAIGWHHAWGKFSLISVGFSAILFWISEKATFNKNIWIWVYRIFLVSAVVIVFITSHRGGELVFEKALGVSLSPD